MTRGYMKKFVSIILITVFAALLAISGSADFRATFSLTGASSARAGESLTVAFKADGNGICGILAEISFDPSVLTFKSSSGALSNWRVEVTEKGAGKLQIWAEENNGFKSPINSQQTVINLNFTVSSSAKTGDKLSVSAKINETSNGEDELNNLSASYSGTVARPLSSDSKLKELSVNGYTISPAFSSDVTDYSIEGEVEYTVSALKITATANDGEAKTEISGARLSVGENTVKIKVTAENGSSTTYSIKAKMKQDPNYVASSDTALSGITLSEGRLSPAFSSDVYDYIVYVPYEADSIQITGTPHDKKASAKTEGDEALIVGDNAFTVICTAENGDMGQYNVKVVRMGEYITTTEEITETETDTDTDTVTETDTDTVTETETDPIDTTTDINETETDTTAADTEKEPPETTGETVSDGEIRVPLWFIVVAAVCGIIIGALACILVQSSLKERK
jgi:hypothetical protein